MENSYLNFNNDKELFEFIRNTDVSNIPDLKALLNRYNIKSEEIENVLDDLKENNSILIDARSENEFLTSSLPYSINFPILKNKERHYVGNIYKNYSQTSAIWLAIEYANQKTESLRNLLNSFDDIESKRFYIYCWRGGGRSKFLTKMFLDLNPNLNISIIEGGFRAYRKKVINFFEYEIYTKKFIELTGLTGCNKSKLLELISTEIPTINLEFSAKHQSSLFGKIPYLIRGYEEVKDQSSFENNIFNNFEINRKRFQNNAPNLIESESRKIGNFILPNAICEKISEAPSILVKSSLEERINVIRNDYFMDDLRGLPFVKDVFFDKGKFFKQQLSKEIYGEMSEALDNADVDKFIEYMLVRYYDIRYKDKGKTPILILESGSTESKAEELKQFLLKYNYAG